ncbi:MAG: hypothetical protein NT166_28160 [Candidatus Aminicenantes bacterium]|nr:hypothetical protein [Candidatus Aminicenantes bacterium]
MSNGARPQVTKITVEFDNAPPKIYPDNGYMPVALFWSDDVVANILGSYYDRLATPHKMTYERLVQQFGPVRAIAACPAGPGASVDLTQKVVTDIWNMPNPPTLLGVMSKDPGCDIGG